MKKDQYDKAKEINNRISDLKIIANTIIEYEREDRISPVVDIEIQYTVSPNQYKGILLDISLIDAKSFIAEYKYRVNSEIRRLEEEFAKL